MLTRFNHKLDGAPAAVLGALVLAAIAFYAGWTYYHLESDKVRILGDLEAARTRNYELMRAIEEREGIIARFQDQIGNIQSTVGTLEKLSQTDEELLKKYSKVYFLNENYVPAKLSDISKEYIYNGTTNYMIHADVRPYLERLIQGARSDGIELYVASAFRSFDAQSALKSSYKVTYGSGANSFSADQGYSEHQLGTSVDFTTKSAGANFSKFATDPAYEWLRDHAHDYGFVLSYPEKNIFYKFEPWHWRFVGRELAAKLHEEGKYFYDLDQREIDTYLVKLFD